MRENELIAKIEQEPLLVKISGNHEGIILSCQEVEVRFPVVDHIFTRFVCSLSKAEVLSTGPLEEVGHETIHAFTKAIQNRKYSSFDLMFKE